MTAPNPYCGKIRDRFDALHDGELSLFMRRVVKQHVKDCAACRQEHALFLAAIDYVRRRGAPDVPPRVLRKVVEEVSGPRGGATYPGELLGPGLVEGGMI